MMDMIPLDHEIFAEWREEKFPASTQLSATCQYPKTGKMSISFWTPFSNKFYRKMNNELLTLPLNN